MEEIRSILLNSLVSSGDDRMQEDNVEMTANGYVEVVRGCIASSVSSSPTCMYQQLFSLSYLGLANLTLSYTHFHLLTHILTSFAQLALSSLLRHIYILSRRLSYKQSIFMEPYNIHRRLKQVL